MLPFYKPLSKFQIPKSNNIAHISQNARLVYNEICLSQPPLLVHFSKNIAIRSNMSGRVLEAVITLIRRLPPHLPRWASCLLEATLLFKGAELEVALIPLSAK